MNVVLWRFFPINLRSAILIELNICSFCFGFSLFSKIYLLLFQKIKSTSGPGGQLFDALLESGPSKDQVTSSWHDSNCSIEYEKAYKWYLRHHPDSGEIHFKLLSKVISSRLTVNFQYCIQIYINPKFFPTMVFPKRYFQREGETLVFCDF